MELNELLQAVQELIAADSAEAVIRVVQSRPQLLEEETIAQLRLLAQLAQAKGEEQMARMFAGVAEMLEKLRQRILERVQEEEQTIPTVSLSTDPKAQWAKLTRQYLALRKDELLEQAIKAAEKAGERQIAQLLRAFQSEDFQTIDRQSYPLHRALREAGREEEAWTIALVGLDIRARLVELFMHFPLGQQAVALEAGLEACKEASDIARALGDEACVALYLAMAGNGYGRAHRFEEAEEAFREAIEIYRRLAKAEPQVYEPYLAMTLNNLGYVLYNLRRFEEAEEAYREALEIRRRLAKAEPQVYKPDLAMTLNNLGTVLSDLR
ncbi:MAG: tetratricopeptide repeat protein, partial [Armatimonadota bacterium]